MNALTGNWRPRLGAFGKVELSVVIPLFNEQEVVAAMHARLTAVLTKLGLTYELLLIDDGSTDETLHEIQKLAWSDPSIHAVVLSRHFGKEAALTAGLDHAGGEAIIITDADLQDPPELFPQMVQAWRQGADMVCMRRRSRAGETWLKRFSARHFYRLLNAISDVEIPPDTDDFRLLSRKALDALGRLNERNRYMKGLFAWIGLRTTFIDYDRSPRMAGQSKWNYANLFNLAFEGITSFSTTPLRWATGAGLLTVAVGVIFTLWIISKALILGDPVQGYPSLISMITVLGGAQLSFIGLLGEYIGKIYYESKQRPTYLVDRIMRGQECQSGSARNDHAVEARIEQS